MTIVFAHFSQTMAGISSGKLINMVATQSYDLLCQISSDVERFIVGCVYLPFLFTAPIQVLKLLPHRPFFADDRRLWCYG